MCGVVSIAFVLPLLVATSSEASIVVTSLDLVILVDESASLKSADVLAEIEAVSRLVARRELSGESKVRVAIAGFGSGEAAVDEKCPPFTVATDNVQDLVVCAERVRRRASSGQHTDFAKAFAYASKTFRDLGTSASARAVILLTDGKYDPVGKRSSSGLTDGDRDVLDSATSALRADGAQIWPLGFGEVDSDELDKFARKGASTTCPKPLQPYAIVAAGQSLDVKLLEIFGAIFCLDVNPPEIVPFDFPVHPFVNEVTLTYRGASEEPNVVVVGSGRSLCVGEWKQAGDGSLACNINVGGADTGVWEITPASKLSGEVPTVETSYSGRVDLRLSACKKTSAVVTVSRVDNTEIAWELASAWAKAYDVKKDEFPRAAIVDTSNGEEIASTVLSASDRTATFSSSGSDARVIEVALASGQADFRWLTASIDTCEVSPPPTIVSVPTTLVGGSDGGVEDPDPPFPWWLLALLVGLAVAAAWLLRRRSQAGKFPEGTELSQRNVAQNPAANWNIRANLSGLREIRFNIDRNGWLVEAEHDQADLIVRRLRSRTEGDFVVVQPARGGEGIETQEGVQAFHAFSVAGESGAGISVRDTFIRVEVPEEIEEDEDEVEDE